MKINIYNKKEIVKTYEAETYNLTFGFIEDFLELVKVDKLESMNKEDITMLLIKAIPNSLPVFKELLKDVFDGITDEELRNIKVSEIITVMIDVIKFAFSELSIGNEKN